MGWVVAAIDTAAVIGGLVWLALAVRATYRAGRSATRALGRVSGDLEELSRLLDATAPPAEPTVPGEPPPVTRRAGPARFSDGYRAGYRAGQRDARSGVDVTRTGLPVLRAR